MALEIVNTRACTVLSGVRADFAVGNSQLAVLLLPRELSTAAGTAYAVETLGWAVGGLPGWLTGSRGWMACCAGGYIWGSGLLLLISGWGSEGGWVGGCESSDVGTLSDSLGGDSCTAADCAACIGGASERLEAEASDCVLSPVDTPWGAACIMLECMSVKFPAASESAGS